MRALLKLIKEYEWVHLGLGVTGNTLFVVGSVFFLFEAWKAAGTWLFIVGSTLMLIGAAGNAVIKIVKVEDNGPLGQIARHPA
jgi:hypothetical protein